MDDMYDFAAVPDSRMALRIAILSAATGALAGTIEGLGVAMGVKLLLSAGEGMALVLASVAVDAAFGFGFGLCGGALAQLGLRRLPRWKRYRAGFTVAALGMATMFLAPLARELWVVQERRVPAIGMIALALSVAITVWFNAGYWFRRETIGAGPRLGWRVLCGAFALVGAAIGGVVGGNPSPPPTAPLPDAPNIVLVTLDTARRDYVGVYGSVVNTPVLDRLGREGMIFDEAITAVPETAPSHASMLTGMHPVIHKVVANGIPLKGGYHTLPEQLEAGGWRTGAFVSSFTLDASSGLGQGFQVYDDDFLPIARGVGEVRAVRLLLPALLRLGDPADWPWLLERAAPDTLARALAWVDTVQDAPFFLWVHLFEPHAPYESHTGPSPVDHRAILAQEPGYAYTPEQEAQLRDLYRAEMEYTDTQVGVLLDGLAQRGVLDGGLVIVAGDHGESLGEHDIRFNHHGLYDEVLRVPLLVWTPEPGWEAGVHISRQVTVADIANTLLEWSGMPLLSETESMPLLSHAAGVVVPPRPVVLVGRLEASLSKGQLCGVRDPNGVKFIHGEGRDELYNLRQDPGELTDIATEQPAAVRSGLLNVEHACGASRTVADPRLEALGYVQ